MAIFTQLPEFERELKKLSKKYPTITSDIEDIKSVLLTCPTGIGKNFIIIKYNYHVALIMLNIRDIVSI